MSELQLMVLLAPWPLHEDVVDALMGFDDISGFSSVEAAGFSREHSDFDIAEQVAGARRFSRFEILHAPSQREEILAAIEPLVGREHFRYWVVQPIEAGRIDSGQ
ncbi:MAG: DUF3240 family protein [Chromatocurvus sp.]